MDMTPSIRTRSPETLVLANLHDLEQNALDMQQAGIIAEALHKHYPGHAWAVNFSSAKGIVTILNLYLAHDRGYVLHVGKQYSASALQANAIRAAGEILERYSVSRGKLRQTEIDEVPTDFAGRAIGDYS